MRVTDQMVAKRGEIPVKNLHVFVYCLAAGVLVGALDIAAAILFASGTAFVIAWAVVLVVVSVAAALAYETRLMNPFIRPRDRG